MSLTNQSIVDIYQRVDGNVKQFHNIVCELSGRQHKTINKFSLHAKAKTIIKEIKRLKKQNNKQTLNTYYRQTFTFPKPKFSASDKKSNLNPYTEKLQKEVLMLRDRHRQINLSQLNLKLKRQQRTITLLRQKLQHKAKTTTPQTDIQHKGVQCNSIKSVINELKLELEDLYSKLDENNNDTKLDENVNLHFRSNSKGRPYLDKVREVYYCFRSRNIGLEHIAPIIQSVLKLVDVHISCDDLPSMSTAAYMTSELGIVARRHVQEELAPIEHLTLHRDATTKKGKHYVGLQFSTGEHTLTAGLREVCDGKAKTYVDCTKEILQDVGGETGSSIISKVSNFMTDRSATEHKANTILAESTAMDTESNFFKCAVHPLLQFSDVCLKEISNLEKEFSVTIDTSNKETSTSFLLKCISKLFYKDGSGDPKLAVAYILENMKISKIPVMKMRGNRFNFIFFNAAGTYYMKDHIKTYLHTSKSSLNYIQDFIFKALSDDTVVAIIRALGLICKHFTEPYWQKAGSDVETAIGMGDIYNRMVEFLGIAIDAPELLLSENHIKLFVGPEAPVDSVSALIKSTTTDTLTQKILKRLCTHLQSKCKQLFKDFLPGGKYHAPSENMKYISGSCPPNNICVERLMAKLDRNIINAPNSNTNSIESTVMFRDNKTADWLTTKSETEQQNIISEARKHNKTFMKQVKHRKHTLFKDNLKLIEQRQINIKLKQQKQQEEFEKTQKNYNTFGLLDTQEKLNNHLQKLSTKKDKITAIKTQFQICKQLFTIQPTDKPLLQLSSKGKQHTLQTLSSNLSTIVEKYKTSAISTPSSSVLLKEPKSLVGHYFNHTWTDEGEDEVWKGRIQYFDANHEEIEDLFDLTESEMQTDIDAGFLKFENTPSTN